MGVLESLFDFSVQSLPYLLHDFISDTWSGKLCIVAIFGVAVTASYGWRTGTPFWRKATWVCAGIAAVAFIWTIAQKSAATSAVNSSQAENVGGAGGSNQGGGGGGVKAGGGGGGAGALGGAGGTYIQNQYNYGVSSYPLARSTPGSEVEYYPTPLNLRNLFDTDFNVTSLESEVVLRRPRDNRYVTVVFQLAWDFPARVKFLAVFLPKHSDTYELAVFVAHTYRTPLTNMSCVLAKIPSEFPDTSSNDLVFSKIVYLYVEDDLPLQQRAQLENIYKNNRLAVQIRGSEYLAQHLNDQRRKLKIQ